MARDVVTGYCWPQSARVGEQVGLHMSSSAGRPVRVEVARIGARREIVFSSAAVVATLLVAACGVLLSVAV